MTASTPTNQTLALRGAAAAAPSPSSASMSADKAAIIELAKVEAEIRSLTKHNAPPGLTNPQQQPSPPSSATTPHGGGARSGGQVTIGAQAYDTLLAHYMEREEELALAVHVNTELDKNLKGLEKMVRELQHDQSLNQLTLKSKSEKTALQVAKVAKLEEESKSQREALSTAEKTLKTNDEVIEDLTNEKDELTARAQKSDEKIKTLQADLTHYEGLVKRSKDLAADQINVLQENEKLMGHLEAENEDLRQEMKKMKEEMKKKDHAIQSKNALLDMQRQQIDEYTNLIQMYERKFLARDMDVPKIVARSDEAERLWSKIEERENKYEGREIIVGVLRDENAALSAEKTRLVDEVRELKKCFQLYELKFKSTGDKVHMPWLLSQLRDSVQLKEKIVELKEIIKGEGYTVKAADAEADFKNKKQELIDEMEKLKTVIKILKAAQADKVDDVELPWLLGKLDEALLVFGVTAADLQMPVDDMISQLLSAASSESLSLNTNGSYMDEKWIKSSCITARDFKEFMAPDQYDAMTDLTEGLTPDAGLCGGGAHISDEVDEVDDDEGILEERDDIVNTTRAQNDDDKSASPEAAEDGEGEQDKEAPKEEEKKRDIHLEKVLKIPATEEEDPQDWQHGNWRTWISPPSTLASWVSPPTSPCGSSARAAASATKTARATETEAAPATAE